MVRSKERDSTIKYCQPYPHSTMTAPLNVLITDSKITFMKEYTTFLYFFQIILQIWVKSVTILA